MLKNEGDLYTNILIRKTERMNVREIGKKNNFPWQFSLIAYNKDESLQF